MLTERQKKVLSAIIEEFVKTNEPVGSKSLTERPELMLDYSSATIRNEMAYLEEMGYLMKTHTSSGRVPSEEGYRFYVSEIVNNKSLKWLKTLKLFLLLMILSKEIFYQESKQFKKVCLWLLK